VVIAAAVALADGAGPDGLTLAALAARLGVQVPSLYKHVDGLDDVRRGVALAGLRDLAAAMTPAKDLHAMSRAYRAFARAHPGRYAGTLRAVPADDPEAVAAATTLLAIVDRVLAERGLAGDRAEDVARLLRATLHGFVALEAAGGFGMPRDLEASFDRAVDALDVGLRAMAADGPLTER
jgi:AcrR family transcriptional regulator